MSDARPVRRCDCLVHVLRPEDLRPQPRNRRAKVPRLPCEEAGGPRIVDPPALGALIDERFARDRAAGVPLRETLDAVARLRWWCHAAGLDR